MSQLEAVEKRTMTEKEQKKSLILIQTEHPGDKLVIKLCILYMYTQTLLDKELRRTQGLNNMELIGRTETVVKLQSKITLHICDVSSWRFWRNFIIWHMNRDKIPDCPHSKFIFTAGEDTQTHLTAFTGSNLESVLFQALETTAFRMTVWC